MSIDDTEYNNSSKERRIHLDKLLSEVNTFKSDLNTFEKIIKKLEYDLNHPNEVIYAKCFEVKRQVQQGTATALEKLAKTADNEMKRQNITKSNENIIDKICQYEIDARLAFKSSEQKKSNFISELNYLRLFYQRWNEFPFKSFFEIPRVEFDTMQTRLNELSKDIRFLIYNYNMIEFDPNCGYLLTVQSINVDALKQIDINKILENLKIESCNKTQVENILLMD